MSQLSTDTSLETTVLLRLIMTRSPIYFPHGFTTLCISSSAWLVSAFFSPSLPLCLATGVYWWEGELHLYR